MAWRNRIVGEGEERPEDLLANPANWRIHPDRQQRALSDVLNTVGLVQRIIVNQRTGFVVDGHARVALAISEGEETIPVEYVDLAPDEEAVVLSTFDPTGAMAGTDRVKLQELISEAQESEAAEANPDLSGFLDELAAGTYRSSGLAGKESPPASSEAAPGPDGDDAGDGGPMGGAVGASLGARIATCPVCGHEFEV